MKFSIIIPAKNEAERITHTILAALKQNVGRENFEIVVIDNNSTDNTAEIARAAGANIVVREEVPGTNIARQRGVKESSGEIVAFLDADTEPSTDWLRHIAKNLEQPGVALTSGPYNYGFIGLQKIFGDFYIKTIFPMIPKILHFFFRKKTGIIIEGNFGAKRSTIEAIGGLPPVKFWGDGAAIAKRVAGHVGEIFFDPTLTVKSSPRRFQDKGFLRLPLRYAWSYLKMYVSHEFD